MLQLYWSSLVTAGEEPPPGGLDADIAAVVRRLTRALPLPEPDSAFVARLGAQLAGQGAARLNGHAPRGARLWLILRAGRPWRLTLAAALALVLLIVALTTLTTLLWIAPPQKVTAQTIVRRAVTAAAIPSGVRSLVATEEAALWPAQGYPNFGYARSDVVRSTLTRYAQGSNRWRVVTAISSRLHATTAPLSVLGPSGVSASDGATVWGYCRPCQTLQVQRYDGQSGPGALWPLGPAIVSGAATPAQKLSALLRQLQACYQPRRLADETVAGRPAYVVTLNPTGCYSASAAEENGRRILWVDKQTSLVLKSVLYCAYDPKQIFEEATVTRIRYNVSLPASLFTYTAPLGTRILDTRRPSAGPNVGAYGAALRSLAARAGFAIFVPGERLAGLALQQPRLTAPAKLRLVYAPPGTGAAASSVVIAERPATRAELSAVPAHAQPVLVAGAGTATLTAWYRPGGATVLNRLSLVREGTALTFSSRLLGRDGLADLAGSLVRLAVAPANAASVAQRSGDELAGSPVRLAYPRIRAGSS
jgi:hypothetical protein